MTLIWKKLKTEKQFPLTQEVLNAEGGPGESLSIMYGTLLRNYEAVKEDYSLIRKRYDDLVSSHSAAVNKLEHSQVSTSGYSIL